MDEKRNALSHPFVEFLRAFLKMIEKIFLMKQYSVICAVDFREFP
jgi:hypothetical protein